MAAIVNDRDASILNAANRFTPDPNRNMFVTPSSGVFKIKGSISDPGQFVFVANLLNLSGNVTWTWSAGITPAVANGNSSYTGNVLTITPVDMGTQMSGKVTATFVFEGITYVREATVAKVADGIVGFLTNESATLAANSAGTLVSGALANGNGTFKVFDGINDVTGTAAVAYSILSETGCDFNIASTGVYTLVSMSADVATAVLQAVYGSVTIQKAVTLAKAKAGATGTPATYVDITSNGLMFTRANATVAYTPAQLYLNATPTGGTATYQWQYWDGAAWVNFAGATGSGITVNSGDFVASRTYRVVATINGSQYYDQMTLAQITGGKDGANGGSGPRGTVNISKIVGFNYWDDGTANQAILDAGYSARQSRDVVTLSNNAGYAEQRFWDGGSWQPVAMVLPGNLIVDGTIGSNKIITESITASKIRIGSSENCVPDPAFDDPKWWGYQGMAFPDYVGNNQVPWRSRRTVMLNPNTAGTFTDRFSQFFETIPNGSYFFEFSVFLSADFQGAVSFLWHLPAQSWYNINGVSRGYKFQEVDYIDVMFDGGSQKGYYTMSVQLRLANTTAQQRTQFRLLSKVWAGYMEIGGVTVQRAAEGALVVNGGITANHLNVQNLRAVAGQIGFFQSAPGGNNRVEISDGLIEIWAANNARRIRLSAN